MMRVCLPVRGLAPARDDDAGAVERTIRADRDGGWRLRFTGCFNSCGYRRRFHRRFLWGIGNNWSDGMRFSRSLRWQGIGHLHRSW